jgi:VanZ family protein
MRPSRRGLALRFLPAILWLVAIISLSSMPLRGLRLPHGFDKVLHLGEYVVLSVLVVLALRANGARGLFLRALAAVPIMALLAAADELHQWWIPGRCVDGLDLVADVAGIVLGAVVALGIVRARGPGGDG